MNKNGECSIVANVSHKDTRVAIYTGKYIKPGDWNDEKQLPRGKSKVVKHIE